MRVKYITVICHARAHESAWNVYVNVMLIIKHYYTRGSDYTRHFVLTLEIVKRQLTPHSALACGLPAGQAAPHVHLYVRPEFQKEYAIQHAHVHRANWNNKAHICVKHLVY